MKVLSINEKDITEKEIVQLMKTQAGRPFLKLLVRRYAIEKMACERNISVTDDELQESFDLFRKQNGLFMAGETKKWLRENGLTLDDIESELSLKLIEKKLMEAYPQKKVEQFFIEAKTEMDAVELYTMTVADREVAMELLAQAEEDEVEFIVLANRYSTDENARRGGYAGFFRRHELRSDMSAAAFGAKPGEIVGPFQTDQGFVLLKIRDVCPAVLDSRTEAEIRRNILKNDLAQEEQRIKITWQA
ncbi:MAG: peptidylprolyl isomerase [Bacillota bacterium]